MPARPTAPSNPSDYVPRFSPEDVLARYDFLCESCEHYLSVTKDVRPYWKLDYDSLVMLNVAQSAMDDIWRYKSYHQRDQRKLSDSIKRSAYFTKWITRFRPIYIFRPSSEPNRSPSIVKNDVTLTINESFAIFVSLNTIASEIKAESIHLHPEFFANFLYDLHYRNLSEDALIGIYEIIRNAARRRSVILKVIKKISRQR
jgi:hypothetical protein